MLPAFAALSLAVISAASMAAQPCAPVGVSAGFLPSQYGGSGSIICGLPASQKPILGTGPEQERKRAEQRAAWSRMLKEGNKTIPVSADEPVPRDALPPRGTKD